ncbi:dienelactone hydrolase family protein [Marimonas arenosa]|uniref:Dienelactone hydrolase family protein n=1 Tax=Marimonas arenosa TaxID=1795305 RepID=A0AAE3WGR2_9RHOB|nr:dienelactone hydrolase family protein [Marimonas arenosa]MDQ2092349.1 dienelactone hydrolase family protein [Marimonas arenosa]
MTDWPHHNKFAFTGPLHGGGRTTHDVYVKGDGPPVLILQELPGIGPQTLSLADRLAARGFRVYLAHFLGPFGRLSFFGNTCRVLCIRREFHIFARGRESPIGAWFRALVAEVSARENGARVGVIGMCLTGEFALALMSEPSVAGGVASQPSLPVMAGDALHMGPDQIETARVGMAKKGPGLAMRYKGDRISTARHRTALERAFGDHLETVEFEGRKHALLTVHFHEPAYVRMEDYLAARLGLGRTA